MELELIGANAAMVAPVGLGAAMAYIGTAPIGKGLPGAAAAGLVAKYCKVAPVDGMADVAWAVLAAEAVLAAGAARFADGPPVVVLANLGIVKCQPVWWP